MRLKTVRCRMAHERVLIDRDSRLPVAGTMFDTEFQRVSLCSAARRSVNIACSHTIARHPIKNALDVLERHGKSAEWRVEFNDLDNAIHLLDHKKGDAEKHLARVIKRISETAQGIDDSLTQELARVSERIAEMEERHSVYAGKIEELKNDILDAINSAIEIEESRLITRFAGESL